MHSIKMKKKNEILEFVFSNALFKSIWKLSSRVYATLFKRSSNYMKRGENGQE